MRRLFKTINLSFLFGKNPNSNKWKRILFRLTLLFIGLWPVFMGIVFEVSQRTKDNTRTAWNAVFSDFSNLTDYTLDYRTLAFILISFFWGFIFFVSIIIQDKDTEKKFDRIRATILKAPDMSAFSNAKSSFDFTFKIIEGLRVLEPDIRAEISTAKNLALSGQSIVSSTHLKKRNDLKAAIITINTSILELAKEFFRNPNIDGVNTMLFFKNASTNSSKIDSICANADELYMRCDHKADLDGILFIDRGLYRKKNAIVKNKPLVLPIYTQYIEVYKNPNESGDECIIPGAMLAFRRGSSMVGDTRNIEKYYNTLDARTQKEIKSFWHDNSVVGKRVRSFASFRIPAAISESSYPAGIINLDAETAYAFGEDEEFFATFYSLIFPMLTLQAEYLYLYKEYVNLIH